MSELLPNALRSLWTFGICAGALAACGKGPANGPSAQANEAGAVIGPGGGSLQADGVTVSFPGGALSTQQALRLSVASPGPTVTIEPDIELGAAANVVMDPARWPFVAATLSQHQDPVNGEWYLLGPTAQMPDGTWQYETTGFSSTRAVVVNALSNCDGAWSPFDVCGSLPNPLSEAGSTVLPPNVRRKDVTQSCLQDASNIVGSRHDSITCAEGVRSISEMWLMSREAARALASARNLVATAMPGYDIWINGAWDSTGACHHAYSFHYFGAALDLVPCHYLDGSAVCKKDRSKLAQLAPLLVQAGFSWVWYEAPAHVHASISSPSLGACLSDGSLDATDDAMVTDAAAPDDATLTDAAARDDTTLTDAAPPDGATLDGDASNDALDDAGPDANALPNCQPGGPGLSDCGASRESCCASLVVPGGSYYRTYTWDADAGVAAGLADPATVSSFRLDKYLVTVGRFRQFVSAWNGGWRPGAGAGKHTHLNSGNGLNATGGGYEPGWVTSDSSNIAQRNLASCSNPTYQTWTNTAGSNENLPINCVNWEESYAFCIWDGGFLPSEAEWEYAAAGGSQQREYPWGSTAPGTACPGTGCQYAIFGCFYPSYPKPPPPQGGGVCSGAIAPVGTATLGAGLWGQLDLAGEMKEWNLDSQAMYVNPCTDCADLTGVISRLRVSRGGFFDGSWADLQLRNRNPYPFSPYEDGLRCARTP